MNTKAGDTRALNVRARNARHFQRTLGINSDERCFTRVCLFSRCTTYRLFGHFTLYCAFLRKGIVQEGAGYIQVTVNDIFMANATHYIPVSEKTVVNSLITSVSRQPPSMNFYVINNSVMCKHTNMRRGIALQGKLYELPVWQLGKQ
jgi:hypothetical protein